MTVFIYVQWCTVREITLIPSEQRYMKEDLRKTISRKFFCVI